MKYTFYFMINLKKILFLTFILCALVVVQAQEKNDAGLSSIFELGVSYGPQFNNFVDYGEDIVVRDGYIMPVDGFPGEDRLLQKREIGTYFNVDLSIRLGGRNYLELGHARTTNQGKYNGIVLFPNGTRVEVQDFQLRNRDFFFKLGYRRRFSKTLSARIGVAYLTYNHQSIYIEPQSSFLLIRGLNTKKYSKNAEAIGYFGFVCDLYQSGRFTLGLESSAYFIISYGPELNNFTISPTLRYSF